MGALSVTCIDCGRTLDAEEGRVGETLRAAGWTMSGGAMVCAECSAKHASAPEASPDSRHPARVKPRRAWPVVAGMAVVGVLVALVVALGGGAGAPVNLDPVAQAADSTLRTSGTDFTMSMSVTLPGHAPLSMTGSGYLNAAKLAGDMSMHMTGLPASAAGALSGGSVDLETVFDHFTYYLRTPALAGQLPGNKSWIRLDLGSVLKQRLGFSPSALGSGQADPGQFLKMLAGSHATVVGRARVRGVPTTEYRGTIDLRSVVDRLPSGQRDSAKAGIDKLIAQLGGNPTIPAEAWIDSSKHVRRMHITMAFAILGAPARIDMTMNLFDFGVSRTISIPPAGEVFDATKLASGTALGG
jgi:hypothetical protein